MTRPAEILLISEARMPTVRLLEQILSDVSAAAGGTLRSVTIGEVAASDFNRRTVPVFARVDTIPAYHLAMYMQCLRVEYWYYLDDNFWELSLDSDIGRYYRHPDVQQRVEYVLSGAQRILVSTPSLRDYLSRYEDKVTQLDSFFDFSLIPRLPPAPESRPYVRGGFASSSVDRGVDLLPVMPQLFEALAAHPELEFELIGSGFDALPDHPRIQRFPFLPDYESYLRFQMERQWDFAIAPLSSAGSNLYKTDNKFREYAAFGIPGIYQDSLPYAAVRDGETGLLVGDRGRSWLEAIELYVTRKDLRLAIRSMARDDMEKRRSIKAVSPSWASEFKEAARMGAAAARFRSQLDKVNGDLQSPPPAEIHLFRREGRLARFLKR